ncbi:baseplate megatron protein TIM-barrel domain-containing protein [Candidatus Deianiraea vastatrix]|uniref:Phage tail protein n=1 Tax=Candidatus Deianiraea vastatrix TaxID=2163644 RepID=A0A5B8XGT6_9RICK|nr:glycoside hydrolase TIM-barrel-like domain-containing protein [Candidatus Deianiraea vastatrix]QED23434.1 Putative phage tail protein [Candidatus Deianiraea vastatrix]
MAISGNSSVASITGTLSTSLGFGFPPELTSIVDSIVNGDGEKYKYNLEIRDVTLQTSTFGRIIPEIYGKIRTSGNIIWTSGIKKEVTQTAVKRDKFGNTQGGQTSTNYSISLAIAICKGVVNSIDNIYADEVLLDKTKLNLMQYLGTQDQMPNSVIQSYEGDENTPAFRDLCYVVIHNFSLNDYNGRVPNFTFDVTCNKESKTANSVISGVCIIPGCGEFAYDTQIQYKMDAVYNNFGMIIGYSKGASINHNNNTSNSDAVASFEKMQKEIPNLKWASVICSWFGSSLDIASCEILPKVEYKNGKTTPDEWGVAGFNRSSAQMVGVDASGSVRYGGTPSDGSILRYIDYVKSKGVKVCFYPFLMVDADGKPWRGKITGNISNVANFFHKSRGYRDFIMHYANLVKGKVDAFIIGSELIGITKITDGKGNFPAVDELCLLANDVKSILGSSVKVIYAADWSEYHHSDSGWFNMDKLWANSAIDAIGIDCYFPCTNSGQSVYDISALKHGYESGEGYDFYYEDSENKLNPKPLSPQYAWKNLEYFWNNFHTNPDGKKTLWQPKMKKIWFCEYGFPSVDCCTNEPNVFYSPDSQDSGFPHLSQGIVDFKAQNAAILAFEEFWGGKSFIEQKFIWAYDARPYPFFPAFSNLWSDHASWRYGHWLNGKISFNQITNIISDFCEKIGMDEKDFEIENLDEYFDGFVLNQSSTAFNILKMFAEIYDFNIFHLNGKLKFSKNTNLLPILVDKSDIIAKNQTEIAQFLTINSQALLPSKIEMLFIDSSDFKINTAIVQNDNTQKMTIKVPIAMSFSNAQMIAGKILQNIIAQKDDYIISLPMKYSNLHIGDVIEIDNSFRKITEISFNMGKNYIDFTTTSVNLEMPLQRVENDIIETARTLEISGDTDVYAYNLPYSDDNTDFSQITLFCGINGLLANWKSCDIYQKLSTQSDYSFVKTQTSQSCTGKIVENPENTEIPEAYLIDRQTKLQIVLNDDYILTSIDEGNLGGQNIAIIGNEIISFANVQYLSDKIVEISTFYRGMFDTEISQNLSGLNFVLIDENICKITVPMTYLYKDIDILAVSNNQQITDAKPTRINISRTNFPKIALNTDFFKQGNGDILITWQARNIRDIDFWQDYVKYSSFYIEIYNEDGDVVKFYNNYQGVNLTITKNEQISLFGCEIFDLQYSLIQNGS